MNTSNTLIKEVERLHQQLALTNYAASAYMDSNGHSNSIYDTAIYEQLEINTQAAGKIFDQLVSLNKPKPEPVDCYNQVPGTGKRPDYNQGVHLLEWLNANRQVINDLDRQWLQEMCNSNKTFKSIYEQLFEADFLINNSNTIGAWL